MPVFGISSTPEIFSEQKGKLKELAEAVKLVTYIRGYSVEISVAMPTVLTEFQRFS